MAALVTPVILSGGTGVRLWPLSRLGRPKQLLALDGGRSLLQRTAERISNPSLFAPPIVVAAAADAEAVTEQLEAAGAPARLLLLEPKPRGTATAIALAALSSAPGELLLVLPSDHAIADEKAFLGAVAAARGAAEAGRLVCLAVAAERAETGYGWIERGDALGGGAFAVASFREKPDGEAAQAMLAHGGWLWNAGIFLFRADAMLAELGRHASQVRDAADAALDGATLDGSRLTPDRSALAAAPRLSIDKAVMERSDRLAVVPAAMGWSDVGSWEAVHALGPRDGQGNVLSGDVVAPGSRGCLVRSDGPTIVALGVEDLVIVATERAVLVVPRGETQRIQEALDALEARRPRAGEEEK